MNPAYIDSGFTSLSRDTLSSMGLIAQVTFAILKMTVDPRVTTVQRVLRRTSLDKLPQYLNVRWTVLRLVGIRAPGSRMK